MTDLPNSGLRHLTLWKTLHAAAIAAASFLAGQASGQVNSGSDGRDGQLNPAGNLFIDMSDRADGVYQYTSVNIPAGVTVSFTPNTRNTPVVWLVQNDCIINGIVDVSGRSQVNNAGGLGGPGGFRGGNGGTLNNPPTDGQGPGGGLAAGPSDCAGGSASHATVGNRSLCQPGPGRPYGSSWLIPLIGGSGGGGIAGGRFPAGGGGGGAILIAASGFIQLNGSIVSVGGHTSFENVVGAPGSGGAVRLVASVIRGAGPINTSGGTGGLPASFGGMGWVRLDALDFQYTGNITGTSSRGFQPIILPTPGQGVQLRIATVAGMNLPTSASDRLDTPAVTIPGHQANPIPIIVRCTEIPLNTPITVTVKPANGAPVNVTGSNNAGTQESSTAIVSMNMPRGGGIIFATAVIPLGGNQGASINDRTKAASYAQTGLTVSGERFAKMEITASLGGHTDIAYITESGKRYSLAAK